MSLYNDRYDSVLAKVPWVSKDCSGRTYLFKYAPHPDRAGYLFVATDLETVTFEEMSGTSIPTRLSHIATVDGGEDEMAALGYSEQQARATESLKSLTGVFEGRWGKTTVERDMDDYFDAVFIMTLGPFKWLFQMTELRGRQPLSFISKQLLSPFAALLAQDRGVTINATTPAGEVGAIVSDSGVARALRRVIGAPPPTRPTPGPASRRASPGLGPAAAPVSPPRTTARLKAPPSPSPARTPRRILSPERTPIPRGPSPARAGPAALSLIPPSSPTPVARRRVHDFNPDVLPSSEPVHSDLVHDSLAAENFVPAVSGVISGLPSRLPSEEPRSRPRSLARSRERSPLLSSPPAPPSGLPSSEADLPPYTTSDITNSTAPSSSIDPLIPTLEGKKKKKKKDPKKQEELEEAEANKRREAMKRRMAGGGGGAGRLGRRRA